MAGKEMTEEQKDEYKMETKKKTPSIREIEVSDEGTLTIETENIDALKIKYYLIDSEILFSRSPFVKEQTEQFSYVKPYIVLDVNTDAP